MKSINEDIKTKNFKQIYLLYGEEAYLKRIYKEKLRNALVEKDDTMNYNYFAGKGISIPKVISISETMPFFAECRLIVIENSGFFKSANDLGDYMKELPETTCFVFVEEAVDKRNRLYKTVKEKGRIVEMTRQDSKTLGTWILSKLKAENKNITRAALELFLSMVGDDMEQLEKELEKLLCYSMGRDSVTPEDVQAVCTVTITNKIFDMIAAVAEKKKEQALHLYYDLLSLKEPPMRILFLIVRQFHLLLQVKELKRLGRDNKEIAQKTSLAPFLVGKYLNQATRFTKQQLMAALQDCIDTEEMVKQGRLNDKIGVEMLIVKYSE
ncbi:MAG: DNA polymerase III subunit delta [Lachnospiraceae bacterium]|nr:DNA polymerase III subunit delta [Lachnospiraceae bacterium]